jgi:hypothetical protein
MFDVADLRDICGNLMLNMILLKLNFETTETESSKAEREILELSKAERQHFPAER